MPLFQKPADYEVFERVLHARENGKKTAMLELGRRIRRGESALRDEREKKSKLRSPIERRDAGVSVGGKITGLPYW